jgi:hypothetical protein
MVGMDALLTCRRVVATFPGTVEVEGRYFQRLHLLNQGLDTSHWRVYGGKKGLNWVHTVLSIDCTSVTVLERIGWRSFSGVGQAIFCLLCCKPEGSRKKQRWRRRRWLNVIW